MRWTFAAWLIAPAPPGDGLRSCFGPRRGCGDEAAAANVALRTEGEKMGANAFINLWVATVPPPDPQRPGGLAGGALRGFRRIEVADVNLSKITVNHFHAPRSAGKLRAASRGAKHDKSMGLAAGGSCGPRRLR